MLRDGSTSVVREVDVGDRSDVQDFLTAVGVRLSDVFGPDRILWVEGRTEELCIPRLLRAFAPQPPTGLAILGVVNTGDLDGHDAEHALKVYDRLTSGASLVAPAVAFVLDREARTPEQRRRLIERCGRHLTFLPRFMYENYLLCAADIACLLNDEDIQRPAEHTPKDISAWIGAHGVDTAFFARGAIVPPVGTAEWKDSVNAAKLLHRLVADVTQSRVSYEDNKARFGLLLTEMGIARNDHDLDELTVGFLAPLLRIS